MSIEVIKGDIFVQNVQAIVNPANEHMAHGGGLAAIIAERAGEALINESNLKAPVPVGHAITTSAGNLPFVAVIHAVGPRWQGGTDGEHLLLAQAHRSAVEEAAKGALISVAFPAVSCGIFGYPVDKAAPVAVEAVKVALLDHPSINRVVFCLPTDEHYKAFAAANRPSWWERLKALGRR